MDEEFPACKHDRKLLVRRRQSNGVWVAIRQCLDCGHNCGAVPKGPMFATLPVFDEKLQERRREKLNAFWERKRQQFEDERASQNAEWRRRYDRHLASPEWAALRRKVLARSGGTCEGCAERRAAHVHHLTYERLGREMLFDLVAVCKDCHDAIHGRNTAPEVRFTR